MLLLRINVDFKDIRLYSPQFSVKRNFMQTVQLWSLIGRWLRSLTLKSRMARTHEEKWTQCSSTNWDALWSDAENIWSQVSEVLALASVDTRDTDDASYSYTYSAYGYVETGGLSRRTHSTVRMTVLNMISSILERVSTWEFQLSNLRASTLTMGRDVKCERKKECSGEKRGTSARHSAANSKK